ncbi:hypothetical protein BH11ACT8_BH11ACT8_14210 [soil metagenome]
MTDGPLLWYLNRSTGVVLLVAFTLSTVLGVLATRGRAGGRLPAFVTQHLHRNLSLLSLAVLAGHITTAVVDTYVDIRWWQALVPFGATYEPLPFELGVIALDLGVVIAVSSLVRRWLPPRGWKALHLTAYAAWGCAVAHSWGIGTDLKADAPPWGRLVVAGCVAVVACAVVYRVLTAATPDPQRPTVSAGAR